jgi:hypothetical protein
VVVAVLAVLYRIWNFSAIALSAVVEFA